MAPTNPIPGQANGTRLIHCLEKALHLPAWGYLHRESKAIFGDRVLPATKLTTFFIGTL